MVHRFDGRSPAFISVLWQSSCFYHDFPCQVFGFNPRDVAAAIVGLDMFDDLAGLAPMLGLVDPVAQVAGSVWRGCG